MNQSAPSRPPQREPMPFDEVVKMVEAQKKPPKRKMLWRMVRVLLLLVLVLLLALAGSTWWLLGTHSGLRFSLFTLPQKLQVPVSIRAEQLQGTLWHGFSGKGWQVQTESADVAVSELVLDWDSSQLWDKHILIRELSAGDVQITPKPVPPKPDDETPLRLPEDLALPFTVNVQKLAVGRISQGETVLLRGVSAAYRYEYNLHRLDIASLQTPWSDSKGTLALAAQRPFALRGKMNSHGDLDGIAVQSGLDLDGSLQEVLLKTDLAGNGVSLRADTAVRPFAESLGKKVGHIRLSGEGISPHAFWDNLPKADLHFFANVLPDFDSPQLGLSGQIELRNNAPAPADKNGIPLRDLTGNFAINESGAVSIENLLAHTAKNGKVSVDGGIYTQKKTLNLNVAVSNLTAADVLAQDFAGKLDGTVNLSGAFDAPVASFKLDTGFAKTAGLVSLRTDKRGGQQTVVLEKGEILPPNGGKLNVAATLELFKDQKIQADIISSGFNPQKLYPELPVGNINGRVRLNGLLAKTVFHADMQFAPSVVQGAALSGAGKVSYENGHLSRADTNIRLGDNVLMTQGSFGKKGNTLALNLNAPALQQFGFGMRGALSAKGTLTNTADGWTQLDAALAGQARNVLLPGDVRLNTLDFKVFASPDTRRPLNISLQGKGLAAGGTVADHIDATLEGTLGAHRLRAAAGMKIDGKPLKLDVAANGGLDAQNQWHGTVGTLDVSGALNLHLNQPMRLEAGAKRVVLGAAGWRALGGILQLEKLVWDPQHGLTTKGRADSLHFSQLHHFYTPPVEHNLVVAGDWDLAYSQSPRGYLNLRQQSGDITLPTRRKPQLGLKNFVLRTEIGARGILSRFSGDVRYGKARGDFNILQAFGAGEFARAPIGGALQVDIAELDTLKNLLPVGQSVKGNINGEVKFGGTLQAPRLQGTVNGDNLYYRNRDVGVALSNGTLKSRLQDRRWIIDALTFRQSGGTITLSGAADYTREEPDIGADVVFDRYPVLDQPNRRLTLSGKGRLSYNGNLFSLNGNLKTDEGRFGFQESSMPTLSDDVVVLGESKKEASAPTPLNLNLVFDLNDRFYFSGQGLNVALGGKLTLTATPQQDLRAVGSVRVVKGQYKAYGQDLVISKGIVSFVGPLDNPNLNIRAQRRNSPVGAGVEVLGNLDNPRISLVANEPMSEKDKLSWLILNRASSGSSADEATLATAASAWLAGNLNDKIGLVDDFGLTSQQNRNAQTGEMNPAQQVLTFGKQLTQNLYLGYEAGLGNASQSVKLVYQLSKSFQAIARVGTQSSGGEIKYQKRFDSFRSFFNRNKRKEEQQHD
ncbi:translocation/assembly module TamB [Conchiformibius steedae DSM 2580]|uniref:Translocation/assembly module TamB n=1 Tax=Conchiformibius steedae DSM 2580 TaxID=1121352 RepID=A0AAE9HSA5_9NEIS|nr:translocation/assembly module TamB domain-containing protein [Conchiformibius steedae]URD66769.1 translocation/assembly module TamB [Conchiformibius steedae DSM 2580]